MAKTYSDAIAYIPFACIYQQGTVQMRYNTHKFTSCFNNKSKYEKEGITVHNRTSIGHNLKDWEYRLKMKGNRWF